MIRRITSVDIGKHSDPSALVTATLSGPVLLIDRLSTLRISRTADPAPWQEKVMEWIGPQGPETLTLLDGSGQHRKTALALANSRQIKGPAVVLQILAGPGTPSDPRILPAVKTDIVDALLRSCDPASRLWLCPRDLENADELRSQLAHYRITNPDRQEHEPPRYAAAAGFKDDLLMALAQALWLRQKLGRHPIPTANACGL